MSKKTTMMTMVITMAIGFAIVMLGFGMQISNDTMTVLNGIRMSAIGLAVMFLPTLGSAFLAGWTMGGNKA